MDLKTEPQNTRQTQQQCLNFYVMLPLCKCNNCETVLIDENPQTDAPKYELTGEEKEMVFINDYTNGGFWACPVCRTDEYLTDL